MASKLLEKTCHYCGCKFVPNPRVGNRQKACSIECQKERKKSNYRAFKKKHPRYWHGRYHLVQEWRRENPAYQKEWRLEKKAKKKCMTLSEIQTEIFRTAVACMRKSLDDMERCFMQLHNIQNSDNT